MVKFKPMELNVLAVKNIYNSLPRLNEVNIVKYGELEYLNKAKLFALHLNKKLANLDLLIDKPEKVYNSKTSLAFFIDLE